MKTRPFFWHIFPSFLLISGFVGTLIFITTQREFKNFYMKHTVAELTTRATLFGEHIKNVITESYSNIDSLSIVNGEQTKTRFTVILSDGKVIGDSDENPEVMDNHFFRPEIQKAFKNQIGVSVRSSATLSRELIYVAIPITLKNKEKIVVRASIPLIFFSEKIGSFSGKIIIASLIIIVVSIIISYILSKRLSKSLVQIKNFADTFAAGTLVSPRFERESIYEISELSQSIKSMARQLAERIIIITRQTNEKRAILYAMIEGVVAIDKDEHIILINRAAGKMLNVDPEKVKGRLIQEVIRHTVFLKFVREIQEQKIVKKREIVMSTFSDRIIEMQGTVIQDDKNDTIDGILLVLHDETHLKKLENIRRDFVSNVSHELRTPLTSIKGFVETLLAGAKDTPEDLNRFLLIIQKHVNRLSSIIDDLLTLSRLEEEEASDKIDREEINLHTSVENAIEVCKEKAQQKNIKIINDIDRKQVIPVNISLFEQLLINLIDNAVKYSHNGTRTIIKSTHDYDYSTISVIDQGPGISAQHLSRIFERFYRVDKARSKQIGGTGLGLSIVKHIINLHNGTIHVDSKLGKGSVFKIKLPNDMI